MNFYQKLKSSSYFRNNFYLLLIFICSNVFSQKNNENCSQIDSTFNYFQITIFKENNEPFFLNIIGNNIAFNKASKNSLQSFLDDLYKNNVFSPILISRLNYLDFCNIENISNSEDLKFIAKFNGLFNKNSKKYKQKINLSSGEQIEIKGVNFRGVFLNIKRKNLEYEKMSIYPTEIYECDKIYNYYIPLKITCISKLNN
jgi:hypothetical protein